MVEFRQRTGVEKIVHHSAFLPESDNGFGKRAGNCGQCAPYFIESVPTDLSGMLYKEVRESVQDVAYGLIKELKAAGIPVRLE